MYYALTYHLKRLYLLAIQLYLNVFTLIYFILNVNDASIKSRDVKTTDSGYYATTDNIAILNAVEIGVNTAHGVLCTIMHLPDKDIVKCLYTTSYVQHYSLNKYLDNNRDDTVIMAYQNLLNKSIPIRLYYI